MRAEGGEGLVARAGERALVSEPESLEASLVKTAKRFNDALAATMLRGVARPAHPQIYPEMV